MNFKQRIHELLYPRPNRDIAILTAPVESKPTSQIADLSQVQTVIEAKSVRPVPHTTGHVAAIKKPTKYAYRSTWTRLSAIELINKTIQHVRDVHGAKSLPRFIYISDEQYAWYLAKTGQAKYTVLNVAIAICSDFEQPCALRNNEAYVVGIQEAK